MEDIINKKTIENIIKDRKSIFYRGLSIILSSIFFANIPLLLFLIYMGVNGFFSYDFFSEGLFGLKVFFFLTSIFVFILSIALFGWVIFLVEKWKKKSFKMWSFIGMLVINLMFMSLFIVVLIINNEQSNSLLTALYIGAISFFLSFHIAFLIHAKPKEQFGSLMAVIFIITFMSLHLRQQASQTLEGALKTYGVGGNIQVTLVPKLFDKKIISGTLVLLSPRNIYIKLNNSNDISTISRERFDVITEHNKAQKK